MNNHVQSEKLAGTIPWTKKTTCTGIGRCI